VTAPTVPTLEPILRMTLHTGDAVAIGETPAGTEEVISVSGGSVEGPGLSGVIAAGGIDVRTTRSDSSVTYVVDVVAQFDSGPVRLQGRGFRFGSAEVLTALAEGRTVDPAQFYFRGTLDISTAVRELSYLNRALVVTSGAQDVTTVTLEAFLVT
jgi:hypothetical protein